MAIHARFLHRPKGFVDRELRDAREIVHLHHRESLQMHVRVLLLQPADQFQKIVEGKIGMQPADNVKLRGAFPHPLRGPLVNLLEGKGVRSGSAGIAAKGAELAMGHANVRRIDVAVDVVIGHVAVPLFAHIIRKPADCQQVGRLVKRKAVVKGQALAPQHLVGDGLQARVVDGQFRHGSTLPLCPETARVPRLLDFRTVQTHQTAAAAPQNSKNSILI